MKCMEYFHNYNFCIYFNKLISDFKLQLIIDIVQINGTIFEK